MKNKIIKPKINIKYERNILKKTRRHNDDGEPIY